MQRTTQAPMQSNETDAAGTPAPTLSQLYREYSACVSQEARTMRHVRDGHATAAELDAVRTITNATYGRYIGRRIRLLATAPHNPAAYDELLAYYLNMGNTPHVPA